MYYKKIQDIRRGKSVPKLLFCERNSNSSLIMERIKNEKCDGKLDR